ADTLAVCCADALALPFADGTFDVVFHQGLLEHFRDPEPFIAENARVLKRGGYILVDVPQRWHYYTVIKHVLIALRLWFAGWEREYSVAELERMLRSHSFSIVSSYGEWFNPPMWYRMLRRGLIRAGVKLPMYPSAFEAVGRASCGLREALLRRRFALYTTVVVGTIARKK
ncbi:MAG TPA: methyltransferase domain-containing protein, partial [Candidatus Bathyarchaeia archaeon]|nr:methyltransferase domain-containing protein [Candidatus Bathyarchaeia archaeon]